MEWRTDSSQRARMSPRRPAPTERHPTPADPAQRCGWCPCGLLWIKSRRPVEVTRVFKLLTALQLTLILVRERDLVLIVTSTPRGARRLPRVNRAASAATSRCSTSAAARVRVARHAGVRMHAADRRRPVHRARYRLRERRSDLKRLLEEYTAATTCDAAPHSST